MIEKKIEESVDNLRKTIEYYESQSGVFNKRIKALRTTLNTLLSLNNNQKDK